MYNKCPPHREGSRNVLPSCIITCKKWCPIWLSWKGTTATPNSSSEIGYFHLGLLFFIIVIIITINAYCDACVVCYLNINHLIRNKKKTQMIILSAWSTLGWDQWPITLTHPAWLGDYTHTPLIGICGTIFPSTNGAHQTLWIESKFQPSDHIPVHWVGIKPTTQDSQSQTQTTRPGTTSSDTEPREESGDRLSSTSRANTDTTLHVSVY